jgi:hypothetical protein
MSSAQAAFHHRQHPGSDGAATGQRRGSDGAATGQRRGRTSGRRWHSMHLILFITAAVIRPASGTFRRVPRTAIDVTVSLLEGGIVPKNCRLARELAVAAPGLP